MYQHPPEVYDRWRREWAAQIEKDRLEAIRKEHERIRRAGLRKIREIRETL